MTDLHGTKVSIAGLVAALAIVVTAMVAILALNAGKVQAPGITPSPHCLGATP